MVHKKQATMIFLFLVACITLSRAEEDMAFVEMVIDIDGSDAIDLLPDWMREEDFADVLELLETNQDL